MIEFEQVGYELKMDSSVPLIQFSRNTPVSVTLTDRTFIQDNAATFKLNWRSDRRPSVIAQTELTYDDESECYFGTVGRAATVCDGLTYVSLAAFSADNETVILTAAEIVEIKRSVDPEAAALAEPASLSDVIDNSVDEWMTANWGTTWEEQAAQIDQNKEDIADLQNQLSDLLGERYVVVSKGIYNISTGYYDATTGTTKASTNYCRTTDLISVDSGMYVTVDDNKYAYRVLYYDADGTFLSHSGDDYITGGTYTAIIPEAGKIGLSIRYAAGAADISSSAERELVKAALTIATIEKYIASGGTLDTQIEDTGLSLSNMLLTAGRTPVFAWVDDDTSMKSGTAVTAGIEDVKELADSLGIKCTFGCITNKLSDPALVELLQQYQSEGFQITNHSNTHSSLYWYGDNVDLVQCEADMITAINLLRENGFINYNDFIVPGGYNSEDMRKMVSKYCRCMVLAGKSSGESYLFGDGRYQINRCFIRPESQNGYSLEEYKTFIDDAINKGNLMVFGTHSGINAEWDVELVTSVLQYIIDSGYTLVTLNEAMNQRMPCYMLQEIFS